MTRDELLALLRKLEHCYPDVTTSDPSPALCPRCEHDGSGHYNGCKLAAAIEWLEDEKNRTGYECQCGGAEGWMLR